VEEVVDPAALEWAATENRVVVTHDVSTLAGHAFARVAAGNSMTEVFATPSLLEVGRAIDDLLLDHRVQPQRRVGREGAVPAAVERSAVEQEAKLINCARFGSDRPSPPGQLTLCDGFLERQAARLQQARDGR
jgi:hypothetical protein